VDIWLPNLKPVSASWYS